MVVIIEWDPCLSDHPSSEFHLKVQGWVARLSLVSASQYSASLVTVFHSLGHESNELPYSWALWKLSLSPRSYLTFSMMFIIHEDAFFFSYKFPLNMDTYFSGALISFPLSGRRANIPLPPSPKPPLLLLLLVIIANTYWASTMS